MFQIQPGTIHHLRRRKQAKVIATVKTYNTTMLRSFSLIVMLFQRRYYNAGKYQGEH